MHILLFHNSNGAIIIMNELPQIFKDDSELFEQYKKIIIDRATIGHTAYRKHNCTPLEKASIETHFMDSSTGTLREWAALWVSGAEPLFKQHGHDGERDGVPIEAKPKIWRLRKKSKHTADGYGSINDLSQNRHQKALNDNLIMQQSTFFGGRIAWIIEFPYSYSVFREHLENQLSNGMKQNRNRICGRFSYKQFCECPDVRLPYFNRKLIEKNQKNIVGGYRNNLFFSWLMDQTN